MVHESTRTSSQLRPRWSVLARNMAVYLLITAACIGAVGILAVRFSSDHILRQVAVSNQRALESKQAIIEERLRKVDNITYQTMYDESTFQLLWTGDVVTSTLLTMRDVIRGFQSVVRSHPWISSIYLYDTRHDYVLSDTKADKESFGDPLIFTTPPRDELSMIGPRALDDRLVVSFRRSFPFFSRRLTGYVVVNADYVGFFDMLAADDDQAQFVVIDATGKTIYPSGRSPLEDKASAVLAADGDGATITIGEHRYSTVHDSIAPLGWHLVYLQSYDHVVGAAALVRRLILASVGVVVVVSALLLWLTTRRLQQPLSVLVKHARGLVGPSAMGQNEYEVLDAAIRQLLTKNLELSERYKAALPYFRKYSLEEFLHTKSWDAERFEAILSTLGVHLRRSHLHVAIVESRAGETDIALRRSIESYLKSHDETLAFLAAEAHGSRVTLIVNTDADTRTVYTVLSGLRDYLAEQSHRVSLAMSAQFDFTAEIPEHFAEVEEQLEHRSFFGDDQVIYDFGRGRHPEGGPAKELPIAPVLDAVRAQDRESALGALRDFSDAIGQRSAGDATYARFAFFELALAIEGILPETTWGEDGVDRRHRFYKRIHDSEHTGELDAFLEEIVTTTIQQLHRVKSEHHEELVRRSIDYLEKHLGESVSVDDVAEAVFISGRYLNQIFKTHTGNTVFEHLSLMRVHRAEDLLIDPSLQIQEIAARVGYGNVQSFIRLFKRHHGMTPVEYRRVAGQSA